MIIQGPLIEASAVVDEPPASPADEAPDIAANYLLDRPHWTALIASGERTRWEVWKSQPSTRKAVRKLKPVRRKGKPLVYRVTNGARQTRTVKLFLCPFEAYAFQIEEAERRKLDAYTKGLSAGTVDHETRSAEVLAKANSEAEERKTALRNAMRPDPVTGRSPSFSEVLRRPEFDLWSAPPKSGRTPRKTVPDGPVKSTC